ncbi:MAG: AAA family ATPase [Planctomycetota bacterium]|nr:AAA family ATPase [Planctomycetota bacterium]MDA1261789.1 AAA family ATPase [Planctomycetota bacterium]
MSNSSNTLEDDLVSVEAVRQACVNFRIVADRLRQEIGRVLVGQNEVVDQVLIALFADGHVLLEGVPGLGKTLLVRTLGQALGLKFSRIQFTPDLMPADILGTQIVVEDQATGQRDFHFRQGPIFAQILLADEINRASPKSQSALLEAMQERSVTVGGQTTKLERPFLVLATQNPIEQEGTYPLPEAQLDRFLLKVVISYAQREDLAKIIERTTGTVADQAQTKTVLTAAEVVYAQKLVRVVLVAPHVQDYAVRLVLATHPGGSWGVSDLERMILVGSSPRGAQSLIMAAKVKALLAGRCAVSTQDIAALACAALRHRIARTFEAEAAGMTCDAIISEIVRLIPAEAQE